MASFFAGIGGFDLGFNAVGVNTAFLCENNPYCQSVLASHWPGTPIMGDINMVTADDIPDSMIWSGGFPCQDISLARGARGRDGLNGERSGLFYRFASLINQKKPRVILIENVAGLFNSNQGRDFGIILQTLTSMGYAVSWRLLNSRYFGVPQSRTRVYLCCWLQDPIKAIKSLFDTQKAYKPSSERLDFMTEDIHENKYPKVPKVSYCLAATSGRHTGTDWSRTYVVTDNGVRRLTPIESERLQGFPDDWTNVGNLSDIDSLRYHAVGNAVSVPVIKWIAERIVTQLSSDDEASFSFENLHEIAPDLKTDLWQVGGLQSADYLDLNKSHKWGKSGFAWENTFVFSDAFPTPSSYIPSSLAALLQKDCNNSSYFLTPNAAKGILRRVDSQGRTLFPPLRKALEKLSLLTP